MLSYRERLSPSPWIALHCLLLCAACILVFAPINFIVGIVIGILCVLALVTTMWFTGPIIEVHNGVLRAGRGTIALSDVGPAEPLTGQQAQHALRTELDVRAFLVIRGWVTSLVKVPVTDARDTTPYWLVSTRHPVELADAINRYAEH